MFLLMNILTVLAIISGWILITLVIKDIFVTARRLLGNNKNIETSYFSSSLWIIGTVHRVLKNQKWRRGFMSKAGLLIPLFQYLIWNSLLCLGFGFLYFGARRQSPETNFFEEIFPALWLSLAISIRFAAYEISSSDTLIYLIANIQFYAGFLFYGFVFFYLFTIWQKAKKLESSFYNLKYGASPFLPSNSFQKNTEKDLLLNLQAWGKWSKELRIALKSCPSLIYHKPNGNNESWLISLNLILETTSLIIVTSDGAIEHQARRTFGTARKILIETTNQLCLFPYNKPQNSSADLLTIYEDAVLSAEVIIEDGEKSLTADQIEMLEVWRFTYQASLVKLAEYLEVEISPINSRQNLL